MIARLLQVLWVVLIIAAAMAAWGSIRLLGAWLGPWAAGGIGVLAVATLHPAAILLNFLVSRVFGDPVPRAARLSPWRAIRMLDKEVDASIRGLWFATPFRSRRPAPRPDPGVPLLALPLLFVHGYFCNRAVWLSFMRDASKRGHVCEAVTLADPFASIDSQRDTLDRAIDELLASARTAGVDARQVVLVTHSMGGLVARAALQHIDATRIAHVITLGTPHHGTWPARFGHSPSVVQMRRDSTWIADLDAREATGERGLARERYTALYSHHDDIVYPQRTAALDGATQRTVSGVGHVALLYDRQVRTLVFERLAALNAQDAAPAS